MYRSEPIHPRTNQGQSPFTTDEMFFLAPITTKRLLLRTVGLLNLAALTAASTNVEDLPDSPVADPGPPKVENVRTQGWPGIVQWTSLEDSYATGVGVGEIKRFDRCVHYSDGYPF